MITAVFRTDTVLRHRYRRRGQQWLVWLLACLVAGIAGNAHAHRSSDAFLSLSRLPAGGDGRQVIQLRWDIALRDLDARLDLDTDRDGRLTWAEVRSRHHDIEQLATAALQLDHRGQSCVFDRIEHALDKHSDGTYAVLTTTLQCPSPAGNVSHTPVAESTSGHPSVTETLSLRYRLFEGFDPGHRAILTSGAFSQVLAADDAVIELKLNDLVMTATAQGGPRAGNPSSDVADRSSDGTTNQPGHPATGNNPASFAAFGSYVATGMHHILVGWDHLAFLALLILPSVLVRRDRVWAAADRWRDSLRSLLLTVTAFTVAHSITLSLSALSVLVPPPSLIEPLIALSIVAAAALNIWPSNLLSRRTWLLAFGFGLIHGFGFASALSDAGLSGSSLAVGLLGFNLGVEVGQLVFIIVLWSPLWLLRHWQSLGRRALPALSMLLGLLGAAWFVQRVFDLAILPG